MATQQVLKGVPARFKGIISRHHQEHECSGPNKAELIRLFADLWQIELNPDDAGKLVAFSRWLWRAGMMSCNVVLEAEEAQYVSDTWDRIAISCRAIVAGYRIPGRELAFHTDGDVRGYLCRVTNSANKASNSFAGGIGIC